ncbi:hypothetical protein ACLOJK_020253 [Asimina triloba]
MIVCCVARRASFAECRLFWAKQAIRASDCAPMAVVSWDEEKADEILKQVEFYLSDSNLPRDPFLMKSIKESEDGLMSLAMICTFTRMRTLLGFDHRVKPEEFPEETLLAVAEIVKKSSCLRLSEDGKRVGRITEVSKLEEVIEQVETRTIAASPFEYNAKHDDVETFFNQHGKVNSVRLPRHHADKRCFSGTALVEFASEEDAKNVLNQTLVYAGVELELRPKRDYDSEREKKMKVLEESRSSISTNTKKSSTVNENYPKGLIIAFKLKPLPRVDATIEIMNHEVEHISSCKSEEDLNPMEITPESEQKNSENVEVSEEECFRDIKDIYWKVAKTIVLQGEEKNTEDAAQESEEDGAEGTAQEIEEKVTEAAPLEGEQENFGPNEIVTREDLKQVFQTFGPVKEWDGVYNLYIDFKMGDESGYIRFEDAESAQKARTAAVLLEAGGIVVKNCLATLEPVTVSTWFLVADVMQKGNTGVKFVIIKRSTTSSNSNTTVIIITITITTIITTITTITEVVEEGVEAIGVVVGILMENAIIPEVGITADECCERAQKDSGTYRPEGTLYV